MTAATLAREKQSTGGLRQGRSANPLAHLAWFAAGAALSFAVPYVSTSILDLQHDWYYLTYFSVILAFLSGYVRAMQVDIPDLFYRSWKWSVGIGIPVAAFLVMGVLSRDSTSGPGGTYAVFQVLWRGLAYGVVDALLLTAFPGSVAVALLKNDIAGIRRRLLFAAATLPLVLIVTGIYHLGYEQFREDGIGAPEFGNTVISIPMLATANPIGSVIAHASMHVAADIHVYETDVYLPPQTEAPK